MDVALSASSLRDDDGWRTERPTRHSAGRRPTGHALWPYAGSAPRCQRVLAKVYSREVASMTGLHDTVINSVR